MKTHHERLTPLDGLRGITAAGIAFFWHFQHFGLNGPVDSQPLFWLFGVFYTQGWNLVDLFFVLSGFVMMYRYADPIKKRSIGWGKFLITRLSKLYPLHIFTMVLVLAFQYIRLSGGLDVLLFPQMSLYHVILNVLMLQTGFFENTYSINGPAWMLTGLMIAYGLFYGIFRASRTYAPLLFAAVAVIASASLWLELDMVVLNSNMMRALNGFFVGCLTYYVHRFISTREGDMKTPVLVGVLFVLFWIVLEDTKQHILAFNIHGYQSVSVMAWPLLLLAVLHVRPLRRIFSLKPLRFLGKISYALYLVHFPVQIIIFTILTAYEVTVRDYNLLFIYIISATIAATWAHWYIEVPAQRAIRKRYLRI